MSKKTLSILTFAGLLALTSCATQTISEDAMLRGQAIDYAISRDITLRRLMMACQDADIRTKLPGRTAQRAWWERNRELVVAADKALNEAVAGGRGPYDQGTNNRGMAFTLQLVDKAELAVADIVQGDEAYQNCVAEFNAYENGERDLNRNEALYGALVQLMNHQKNQPIETADVTVAVAQFDEGDPSRSLFAAERLVKREGCALPKMRVLKNEWPSEVFDAVCDSGKTLLIKCEWRSCKIVD